MSERGGSTGFAGGRVCPASQASVEGEAPSGFAGGGGDASPFNIDDYS
ncbi:MAG: hypothetical protein AAB090_08060 [Nitrospirota bacterium]